MDQQQIPQKSVILFDGVCNFCNAFVNFVRKHDKNNVFSFAPIQTKEARALLRKTNEIFINLQTVYLVENNVNYKRSRAVFRIFRKLPYPWKLISLFRILPVSITD